MSELSPLQGRLVVDLSQQLPGPFATLLLRTLGARVVKVEPPGGDTGLRVDPELYRRVSADKEIVTLDLKSESGRAELHRLVAEADVFVEGFRPGVTARLDADYQTLSALNPGLVYCSISGYGPSGPLVASPGHDLNYLALSGGLPDGLPDGEALIRVPWVDLATASNAALAILAALMERGEDGPGRHLEIAMLDAAAVWSAAKPPRPGAEGSYGVFATSDGERVAVSVLEQDMWERLCEALGWEDWLTDPGFAGNDERRARAETVEARLREAIEARSAAELLTLAERHDLPLSKVNELSEAAADPQLRERDVFPDATSWRLLGQLAAAVPFKKPTV